MATILNMTQQLLELGRCHLAVFRTADGMEVLNRLLRFRALSPLVSAEANFLVAQVHFRRADYQAARQNLAAALRSDPDNADCHHLLAQTYDADEEGCPRKALKHYARAWQLAPRDARKASAYALKLVRTGDPDRGLRMLEQTYARHGSDPSVVEDFVNGLLDARRFDDAELLLKQTLYRHRSDAHFQAIRRRVGERLRKEWLASSGGDVGRAGSLVRSPGADAAVLPFRNFSAGRPRLSRGTSTPTVRPVKDHRRRGEQCTGHQSDPPMPVALDPKAPLTKVLRELGSSYTARLYHKLELFGKTRPDVQRREIVAALSQAAFLSLLVKRLPLESRRLLRTLVRAGGYVPATVLRQNTGPEAPAAGHELPLVESGLLFYGRPLCRGHQAGMGLVAVIPFDLRERLAKVLRIKLAG